MLLERVVADHPLLAFFGSRVLVADYVGGGVPVADEFASTAERRRAR